MWTKEEEHIRQQEEIAEIEAMFAALEACLDAFTSQLRGLGFRV